MSSSYVYLITDPDMRPIKGFTHKYEARHWLEKYYKGKPIRVWTCKSDLRTACMEEKDEVWLNER